ncbi:hypothetical protein KCP69_25680 [Salmonella enterica subsp. enterica]|nr:hypothetical protein KCP69_25680 [Salmonella enterica subsp. enterica]
MPLTKTDVAGDGENCASGWRVSQRPRPVTVVRDIDPDQLFNTSGVTEENVLASQPRFHFIADKARTIVSSNCSGTGLPVWISGFRQMETCCRNGG